MLVEELREKDRYGAFAGYVSIAQAKSSGTIPKEYHDIFEDFCECGSERIISVELTKFMCCNPRCPIKLGYNLEHVFRKFSCENIGEKTCLAILKHAYKYLEHKSHISVLELEDKYFPSSLIGMPLHYFKMAISRVKGSSLSFPVMVSRLGIPKFDNTAIRLFGNIANVDMLVDKIEKAGGVRPFLISKRIYDPMRAFYLDEYLYDIALAQYKVFKQLVPIGKMTIPIVMTGHLNIDGIRITKDQFVSLCNQAGQVSPSLRLFDIRSSTAIESASYFIADYESSSAKYVAARRRESAENRKLIYTSKEFLQMLRGLSAQYEESNKPKGSKEDESSVSEMEVFE